MKRMISKASIAIVFCVLSLFSAGQNTTKPPLGVEEGESSVMVKGQIYRDLNKNGKLDIYEDYTKQASLRAKDLLVRMTLVEKLMQLQCPFTSKTNFLSFSAFDEEKARKNYPDGLGGVLRLSDGSYIFSKKKSLEPEQLISLSNQVQRYFVNHTRLGIPVLFFEEALHGLVVKRGTMFPSSLGMSSSWNPDLTSQVFDIVAREASAVGTHVALAPVLDLALDPRWGRTEETMGEDPYLTTVLGMAKVKALHGNNGYPDKEHVGALLKHLGVHGQSENGINTGPVFLSDRWLREVNFKPFEATIQDGKAIGVMPNYNELSGVPAHANKWLLTDVLREDWGFEGIVLSDYHATPNLIEEHFVAADSVIAGTMAIKAGVDMELTDDFMYQGLPAALEKGLIKTDDIDKAVLHVLRLKFNMGLFDHPYYDEGKADLVGSDKHREVALEAARQSVVLLKNGDGILPIDRNKFKKIAVIGPNADRCILGGYSGVPKTEATPLEAIREKYSDIDVLYAEGCKLSTNRSNYGGTKLASAEEDRILIHEAIETARDAEIIVLMLGSDDRISHEATTNQSPGDLVDLELVGRQNELVDSLKTLGKPIVAFVFSGPPIAFSHLTETVSAIVQCWYLGQETGYAVAETLFGDNNPSGKLSISIPRSAAHLPSYYYRKPTSRMRGYNLGDVSPLFPFGFGLSYTSFEYRNLALSKETIEKEENVIVSVDVQNTGKVAGDEIVQLYIRDKVSSVTRPVKELKDFKRIHLVPDETKNISFSITTDKLKFYNLQMEEVVEQGEFEIMVGSSSDSFDTVNLHVD